MENLKKDLLQTSLALLKILFRDYPPSTEVKHFVETGESVINEATLSHVLYYLFTIISKEKTTDILMMYWPLTSSKTRAHFRMGVKKMVAWINAEWPEANLRFTPSQLQSPKTTVFYRFLLKLCLLTIKLYARKHYPEDTMTIPELNFVDCDLKEKLSLYKNKADVQIRSFTTLKNELEKEYHNKGELLRKLENSNLALKKALDENDVLPNLVKSCPIEYRSKLLSDQDWKTAVFEWSNEVDKIEKSCEKNNTILEEVVPEICRLSALKNISDIDNTILDAEEILSYSYKIFETFAKENQGKLSLPHCMKVCKITSEKTKSFLKNVPPFKLFESEEEAEKTYSNLENIQEFYGNLSNKFSELKSDLIKRCTIIEQSLKDENQPRNLSNFFESPLLKFPDEVKDSPEFSSPGLTGAQLLELTKKQLKAESGNEKICEMTPPTTLLVSEENHTPVSRKKFQIPTLIKNKPILAGDSSENRKGMARPKTALPKPTLLSSTLCSESSKKNLQEFVENSVDESLSPILIRSESEDFFGAASLLTMPSTSTTRESSELQKRKSKPSLEALIEKYKSIVKKIEEDENE